MYRYIVFNHTYLSCDTLTNLYAKIIAFKRTIRLLNGEIMLLHEVTFNALDIVSMSWRHGLKYTNGGGAAKPLEYPDVFHAILAKCRDVPTNELMKMKVLTEKSALPPVFCRVTSAD